MSEPEYRESDIKYLEAIIENPDPVFTAIEVADMAGVTQQAAHAKLSSLYDRGLVERKKVGSKAVVWWPTTGGIEVYKESRGGS